MISNQKTMESSVSVLMAVAVSSNGRVDCHIAESPYVQQKRDYEAWISDKRILIYPRQDFTFVGGFVFY